MNIATESARKIRVKQIKKIIYYNCEKVEYIAKICLKLKKDHKNKKNNKINNKKIKNRAKAKAKDIAKKSVKFDN